MFTIDTLKEFASIKPYQMTDRARVAYLLKAADALEVSPNALVNTFRDSRDAMRELSEIDLSELQTALLHALVNVALFNSRRCYHTWLATRS